MKEFLITCFLICKLKFIECVQKSNSVWGDILWHQHSKKSAIRTEGQFVVSGDFDLAKIITVVHAPHGLCDNAVMGALSKYGKTVTPRKLK